jgi:hypothetical protein
MCNPFTNARIISCNFHHLVPRRFPLLSAIHLTLLRPAVGVSSLSATVAVALAHAVLDQLLLLPAAHASGAESGSSSDATSSATDGQGAHASANGSAASAASAAAATAAGAEADAAVSSVAMRALFSLVSALSRAHASVARAAYDRLQRVLSGTDAASASGTATGTLADADAASTTTAGGISGKAAVPSLVAAPAPTSAANASHFDVVLPLIEQFMTQAGMKMWWVAFKWNISAKQKSPFT